VQSKGLEQGEAEEHAAHDDGQAVGAAQSQERSSALVVATAATAVRAAAAGSVGEDDGAVVLGARAGLAGAVGQARRGRGDVDALGVLGAAGVVLAAGRRAARVAAAAVDALVAPFLAGEVGNREGVLRHVGPDVVAAQAAVGQDLLKDSLACGRGENSGSESWRTGSQVLTSGSRASYWEQIRGQERSEFMHQFSVAGGFQRLKSRLARLQVLHTSLGQRDRLGIDLVDFLGVGDRDKGGHSQGRESGKHRGGSGRVVRRYRGGK
jgi:hypothetical protein